LPLLCLFQKSCNSQCFAISRFDLILPLLHLLFLFLVLIHIGLIFFSVTCDHGRAWAYFTEAVLNPTDLVAQKCSNWAQYKINYCDKETVPLGDLNTTLTGNFYLETNKEKPYNKKSGSALSLSRLLSG